MRIGLDLDGVVVDSINRWIDVLNRVAGTNYRYGELPDTHGTPEMAAISDRHELDLLIPTSPMPGAREAIAQLRREGHELIVVTARHPRLRGLTEAWLHYHAIQVDRLHFLEGAPKAPVARSEGLDVLVEDTPRHARTVAEAGVPVLLFAAPYNEGLQHPLIHRCSGWEAVVSRLTTMQMSRAERGA